MSFDLSLLSHDEAHELYRSVSKYQQSGESTYEQRGWCAGVLDKLMCIMGTGDTFFPVCDQNYTYVIEQSINYNSQSN